MKRKDPTKKGRPEGSSRGLFQDKGDGVFFHQSGKFNASYFGESHPRTLLIGTSCRGDQRDSAGTEDLVEASKVLLRQRQNYTQDWQPLPDFLSKRPMTLEEILAVSQAIASALGNVHEAGEVIRDLRSETIYLHPKEGHVRFRDIGIAADETILATGFGESVEDVLARAVRGASPEQVVGAGLDPRSNLFSLGSLIYEMVTGVAPFLGSTALETASRVLAMEASPASELREDIPPDLDALLSLLLEKDVEKRPHSAAAAAAALAEIGKGAAEALKVLDTVDDLDAEIETLYGRLDTLIQTERAGSNPEAESEITQALDELRRLQKIEAARFREEFEARLAMPVDAGEQILGRARALREKLEGLTASHSTSR